MNKPLPCPCCGQDVYVAELATRYAQYAIAHTKKGCTVSAVAGTEKDLLAIWNSRKETA